MHGSWTEASRAAVNCHRRRTVVLESIRCRRGSSNSCAIAVAADHARGYRTASMETGQTGTPRHPRRTEASGRRRSSFPRHTTGTRMRASPHRHQFVAWPRGTCVAAGSTAPPPAMPTLPRHARRAGCRTNGRPAAGARLQVGEDKAATSVRAGAKSSRRACSAVHRLRRPRAAG